MPPVSTVDLAPTVGALAGIPPEKMRSFQGRSLLGELSEASTPAGQPVYAESYYARNSLGWHELRALITPLSKALVHEYRVALTEAKLAPSTINVQLSAIRKLAAEAADNRLLDADLAAGIAKVRGVKNEGVRAGNRLTREQARELLLVSRCTQKVETTVFHRSVALKS
jgi:hypothetical protein